MEANSGEQKVQMEAFWVFVFAQLLNTGDGRSEQ